MDRVAIIAESYSLAHVELSRLSHLSVRSIFLSLLDDPSDQDGKDAMNPIEGARTMEDYRIDALDATLAADATSALALELFAAPALAGKASTGPSQSVTAQPIPTAQYESEIRRFMPAGGPVATNTNDLRRFIYEWFTHFEHVA